MHLARGSNVAQDTWYQDQPSSCILMPTNTLHAKSNNNECLGSKPSCIINGPKKKRTNYTYHESCPYLKFRQYFVPCFRYHLNDVPNELPLARGLGGPQNPCCCCFLVCCDFVPAVCCCGHELTIAMICYAGNLATHTAWTHDEKNCESSAAFVNKAHDYGVKEKPIKRLCNILMQDWFSSHRVVYITVCFKLAIVIPFKKSRLCCSEWWV